MSACQRREIPWSRLFNVSVLKLSCFSKEVNILNTRARVWFHLYCGPMHHIADMNFSLISLLNIYQDTEIGSAGVGEIQKP